MNIQLEESAIFFADASSYTLAAVIISAIILSGVYILHIYPRLIQMRRKKAEEQHALKETASTAKKIREEKFQAVQGFFKKNPLYISYGYSGKRTDVEDHLVGILLEIGADIRLIRQKEWVSAQEGELPIRDTAEGLGLWIVGKVWDCGNKVLSNTKVISNDKLSRILFCENAKTQFTDQQPCAILDLLVDAFLDLQKQRSQATEPEKDVAENPDIKI
jgi:hypothetical protein